MFITWPSETPGCHTYYLQTVKSKMNGSFFFFFVSGATSPRLDQRGTKEAECQWHYLNRISSVCKYSPCYRVIVLLFAAGFDRQVNVAVCVCVPGLFIFFTERDNRRSCWHISSKPVCEEPTQWTGSAADRVHSLHMRATLMKPFA